VEGDCDIAKRFKIKGDEVGFPPKEGQTEIMGMKSCDIKADQTSFDGCKKTIGWGCVNSDNSMTVFSADLECLKNGILRGTISLMTAKSVDDPNKCTAKYSVFSSSN